MSNGQSRTQSPGRRRSPHPRDISHVRHVPSNSCAGAPGSLPGGAGGAGGSPAPPLGSPKPHTKEMGSSRPPTARTRSITGRTNVVSPDSRPSTAASSSRRHNLNAINAGRTPKGPPPAFDAPSRPAVVTPPRPVAAFAATGFSRSVASTTAPPPRGRKFQDRRRGPAAAATRICRLAGLERAREASDAAERARLIAEERRADEKATRGPAAAATRIFRLVTADRPERARGKRHCSHRRRGATPRPRGLAAPPRPRGLAAPPPQYGSSEGTAGPARAAEDGRRTPLPTQAPLRSLLLDPKINNLSPSRTQSEYKGSLRTRNVPHRSYDVDGDGAAPRGGGKV